MAYEVFNLIASSAIRSYERLFGSETTLNLQAFQLDLAIEVFRSNYSAGLIDFQCAKNWTIQWNILQDCVLILWQQSLD